MASTMLDPLLSITHSARTPIAASVISAREARPVLAMPSSTCVAQIAGVCAASHSHRISSWTSASRSNSHSTARSPRAIITPHAPGSAMAASSSSGRRRKARGVSIFSTRPRSAPLGVQQRPRLDDVAFACTNDNPSRSAWRATNGTAARPAAVNGGRRRLLSGRLMPLSARSLAPPGAAWRTRTTSRSAPAVSTRPPMRPSSKTIAWPARTRCRARDRRSAPRDDGAAALRLLHDAAPVRAARVGEAQGRPGRRRFAVQRDHGKRGRP